MQSMISSGGKAISTMEKFSKQTYSVSQEYSASARELMNYQLALKSLAQEITDLVKETDEILQFINGITLTSNLLG